MKRFNNRNLLKAACLTLLSCASSWASIALAELSNPATIYLVDRDGEEHAIGTLTQTEQGDSSTIEVELDGVQFTDQFLSMRPFRCIEGEQEWFCHLPYPYELDDKINRDDLTDLEYRLLFLRKTPAEFGIDAWNGLYYRLSRDDDGTIHGTLLEGDLNVLASPSDDDRPIDLGEFIEGDPDKRLFPSLIIR